MRLTYPDIRDRVNQKLGYGKYSKLALATGMRVEHISRVWRGQRSVSFTAGYRIAKAAGITMEQLYAVMCADPQSICRREQAAWEAGKTRRKAAQRRAKVLERKLSAISAAYRRTPLRRPA